MIWQRWDKHLPVDVPAVEAGAAELPPVLVVDEVSARQFLQDLACVLALTVVGSATDMMSLFVHANLSLPLFSITSFTSLTLSLSLSLPLLISLSSYLLHPALLSGPFWL